MQPRDEPPAVRVDLIDVPRPFVGYPDGAEPDLDANRKPLGQIGRDPVRARVDSRDHIADEAQVDQTPVLSAARNPPGGYRSRGPRRRYWSPDRPARCSSRLQGRPRRREAKRSRSCAPHNSRASGRRGSSPRLDSWRDRSVRRSGRPRLRPRQRPARRRCPRAAGRPGSSQ